MKYKFDLQLFAEEVEEVEEVEEETTTDTDETDTEDIDTPDTDAPEPEETVPLATLLEERNKRKAMQKRLKELESKAITTEADTVRAELKKKYTDLGYDQELADAIAEDIASVKAEIKRSTVNDDADIDEDIVDLSRDAFFKDADTYKKEIKSKINEYGKRGIDLSVEDAYLKVRGKVRAKEYQTEVEQMALQNRRQGETRRVPSSTPTKPSSPYPLDDNDKKALKMLQQYQPSVGWTVEKYYKSRKG